MGEEIPPSTNPQAGNADNPQPQVGDTTSTTSQAGESPNKPSKSAEDYERMIAELRKENAGHRTKLKKFEEDEAKRTEAQLTKEQLLEKQYNDLKAQHEEAMQAHTERTIKHEVALEAAKLGVDSAYLDKVSRFLEWENIEIDEQTGNPTNIRQLVEQLVKDMPALKSRGAATPTSGGATNPARSTTGHPTEITAAYVGEIMSGKIQWQSLTPEQRTAVLNWQAKNPYRF